MEGGKELVHEGALFITGKFLGSITAITLFSLLFSLIINQLSFNKSAFLVVLACAAVLHLLVQGMVKRKWL